MSSGRACSARCRLLQEQETEYAPLNLDSVLLDHAREAQRLRTDLAIDPSFATRWASLSVGERKKTQIACALSQRPDVLLIDEPTNHVDEPSRLVILRELQRFEGVGLLISHDRLLLNDLCTTTIFLANGRAATFHTTYDVARREWEQSQVTAAQHRDRMKGELARVQDSVVRQGILVAKGRKTEQARNRSQRQRC